MMHPAKVNIFTNENFGDIRTITIGKEPWFAGIDIANALGYAKARNAIRTHVDEEDLRKETIQTNGGPQEMTVINESGMYSMILGSRIPAAKQFKRWVTSEVLPKIRQDGIYSSLPDFSNPVIAARAWADELENSQKAEAEAKRLAESNAKKTALLKEQEPKVEYYDTIAKGSHENLVSIRDACKLIGAREKIRSHFSSQGGIFITSRLRKVKKGLLCLMQSIQNMVMACLPSKNTATTHTSTRTEKSRSS